jgi:nicotinate-nucleotide pyrophosphorylase (carboxylating)
MDDSMTTTATTHTPRSHDPDATIVLPADLRETVAAALKEDVGSGDLTAALVPARRKGRATVITRESAVVAGRPYVDEVFRQVDPGVTVEWHVADGDAVQPNQLLYRLSGPARSLLTGERTALNFYQVLSATATATRRYADLLVDLPCRVLDTRKTLPCLRNAQKYAVRCGGGVNHRIGLYDGILVKENHIIAVGSIGAAVTAAKSAGAGVMIEVEVETLDELRQALAAGADMALLDEFSLDDLRAAVALNRAHPQGPIKLEASGSVSLETLRSIAATGVDFISVGSLTKHVRAVDLSMRFEYAD